MAKRYVISERAARELDRMRKKLDGINGDGVVNLKEGITIRPQVKRTRGVLGSAEDGLIAVSLTTDGSGTDGDESSPPDYTYTATDRISGRELGVLLTPVAQRTNGSFTAATVGLGQYENGSFVLIWCDEVANIGVCTT